MPCTFFLQIYFSKFGWYNNNTEWVLCIFDFNWTFLAFHSFFDLHEQIIKVDKSHTIKSYSIGPALEFWGFVLSLRLQYVPKSVEFLKHTGFPFVKRMEFIQYSLIKGTMIMTAFLYLYCLTWQPLVSCGSWVFTMWLGGLRDKIFNSILFHWHVS